MFEILLNSLKVIPPIVMPGYTGPGPDTLLVGNAVDGYFGQVSNADLFNATELTASTALTTGTLINATTDWLKFIIDGKVLFVPKQPIRQNIQFLHLYNAGLVFGTDDNGKSPPAGLTVNQNKRISKNGTQYILRLLKVANGDPYAGGQGGTGDIVTSEYNRTIIKVSAPSLAVDYPAQAGLFASLSGADLGVAGAEGMYVYGQEKATTTGGAPVDNYRLYRRPSGSVFFTTKNNGSNAYAWRPVLELVGQLDFPGQQTLTKGDASLGHYGMVPQADFITYADLFNQMNVKATAPNATLITANAGGRWIKGSLGGKVCYYPEKNISHTASWLELKNANLTGAPEDTGKRYIAINGVRYRVRLMNGGNTATPGDPTSEWNKLMVNMKNGTLGSLTDAELDANTVIYSWCYNVGAQSTGYRVLRGGHATTGVGTYYEQNNFTSEGWLGWRPLLIEE